MLIRRSTLSFVSIAALTFIIGSSLVAWTRPEYVHKVIPSKWRDWTGLDSKENSDIPLPIRPTSAHEPDEKTKGGKPTKPSDEVHILPSDGHPTHDVEHEVQPLPVSIDTEMMKIEIKSEELKKRLYALLSAPLWGFRETVDAFAKACPREVADEQVNPDQLVGNEEFWTTIVNPELVKRRVGMVKYLEKLEESGQAVVWDGKGKGRGIVMTGGNQDTTARLLVTLRILRKEYKTSLPVEIFSFPGEIQDEALLKELEELNAVVKELPGRTKLNIWKNFQIKADAIVSSSFEEVLYLDSDNVPTRDPTYLFNADIYKKNGKAVFWPDLNKDHPDNPIWRLLGKPCDYSQWEIESGQIIISKSGNDGLNLAALHLASHMQEQHEFYFRLSGGDKDTFRYAFWALRLPFGVSPRYLSALGFKSQYDNGRFCGIAMLQYDLIDPPEAQATSHPTPLFVHGNLLKHMNLLPSGGGSPFSVIKRFSTDVAKSRELDGAKMYVYNVHGMCIDLELLGEAAVEKGGKGLKIVEEAFEEVYGGLLKRFSEIYYKHGGKGGGWR